MRADYLSYQRATTRSLIGLSLQVLMGLAVLIYAVRAHDHAALSVALYMGLGTLVWLGLAIVYDQHRRERVEAIEAESLASQQAGTSVFERSGDEFRVASRRLATMYKYLLPGLSLLFGAGLMLIGFWRLNSGRPLVDPAGFATPTHRGWAISVELGVAAIGFIFARYMSGMAKQPVWQNLRAGAGQAVGAAVFCIAMVIAHFLDIYGPDAFLRSLQVVIPGAMIGLGGEVFLQFLLDLYRPRKAGESPRPAFDSRLLSFLAAPDRIAKSVSDAINYQFGYNVSSTWLYQLLARSSTMLFLGGLVVMWLLSALTVVQPHQRALVLRFGSVTREIGPGLHLKMPWPIDSVHIPEYITRDETGKLREVSRTTTGLRLIHLATLPPANDQNKPILWTNEHATNEVFQLVQPADIDAAGERGNDVALIALEMPLHYRIKDVETYERLANPADRDRLLKAVAQREVVRFMATLRIDEALGTGRAALAPRLRERIEAAFAKLNPDASGKPRGAGVEIVSIATSGIHPPQKAAAAFERVVQAQQNVQGMMEVANSELSSVLTAAAGSVDQAVRIATEINKLDAMGSAAGATQTPEERRGMDAQRLNIQSMIDEAGGRAAALIAEAKADRWTKHMSERGRAARYLGQLAAYQASPTLFKASLYFDALRDSIVNSRLYITDPNVRVRTDLTDKDSGRVFQEETANPQ